MEFQSNILRLHGSLLSLRKRELLNKLDLSEAIKTLDSIFNEFNDDKSKLQMTFFLILNSDLVIMAKLKQDENIGLFSCIMPPIDIEIILEILHKLKLHDYLNTIVEHCHSSLTNEIVLMAIKKFNFLQKHYNIEQLLKLRHSLFVKIHNIFKGYQIDNGAKELVNCFQKLNSLIVQFLENDFRSNIGDTNSLLGEGLYDFFSSLLYLIDLYNDVNYKFKQNDLFEFKNNFENCEFEINSEPSKVCLQIIFDSLNRVMNLITKDLWTQLSNVRLDQNETISVQEMIGETIYCICEKAVDVPSDILCSLSSHKIQPKSEAEKIILAGMDEIMANIKEGKVSWFKAFIHKKYYKKEKNILFIVDHLHLADEEDISLILSESLKELSLSMNSENLSALKKLFLIAMKHKHVTDYKYWSAKVFENYNPNLLKLESSDDNVIQIFNKITEEQSVDISDLVCLCFQSPELTLTKICQTAVHNLRQTDFCLNVLEILKSACLLVSVNSTPYTIIDSIVLKIIKSVSLTSKDQNSFLTFFSKLKKTGIITGKFSQNLLSYLSFCINEQNFEKILFVLNIIKISVKLILLEINKFCLLVFMGHVLNQLSWNLYNFATNKADGKDMAGHIIADIMSNINYFEEGQEVEWTRQQVVKYSKINQVYFFDLWLQHEKEWTGSSTFYSILLALIHKKHKLDFIQKIIPNFQRLQYADDRHSIVIVLAKLLPIITYNHWHSLHDNLKIVLKKLFDGNEDFCADFEVLNLFSLALYILSLQYNDDKNICSTYKYCLRNFGQLIKLSINIPEKFRIHLFERIIFFLQAVDIEEREMCSLVVLPVLVSLIESDLLLEIQSFKLSIKRLIKILDVKKVSETINIEIDS